MTLLFRHYPICRICQKKQPHRLGKLTLTLSLRTSSCFQSLCNTLTTWRGIVVVALGWEGCCTERPQLSVLPGVGRPFSQHMMKGRHSLSHAKHSQSIRAEQNGSFSFKKKGEKAIVITIVGVLHCHYAAVLSTVQQLCFWRCTFVCPIRSNDTRPDSAI